MAHILCIETGTPTCSVALCENGNFISIRELHAEETNHASNLSNFIQEVLKEGNISASQLSAVAVSKGPGSYTGLRIGVSTAKGICYAAGIPLIAINSLKVMAQGAIASNKFVDPNTLICSTIDARRMEVYTAVYDLKLNCIMDTQALILSGESFADLLKVNKILFIGNGTGKVKSTINSPNTLYLEDILPSARFMIPLAYEQYNQKAFEDVAYFEPFYLKDFVAIKSTKNILGNG